MKIKQSPDDFRVEELTAVTAGDAGPFALYCLEKRNWTTPDAVENLRRSWKLDRRQISFGGLKDRHAHTLQYLTILQGPKRDWTHPGCTVRYRGQVAQEYTADDIRANRFTLVIRDLSPTEVERARRALAEVAAAGAPNYFDDQRFGSVGDSRSFVAKEMVLGNFEAALKLAIAAPYEHDRADAKKEKATLRAHWGRWSECRAKLRHGPTRRIIEHLLHRPDDFRGALARLHPELQGLYLAAWQSHLWNRMLARWLETHLAPEQLGSVALQLGKAPVPIEMPAMLLADWESLRLPLPSARLRFDPGAVWASLVEAVMAEEGVALAQMKIQGMHKPFFSKGERPARLYPERLEPSITDDDKHPGRSKLTMQFELPRGAYATMLVKRVTQRVGR